MYQEKGVYNFYLKAKAPTQGFGRQAAREARVENVPQESPVGDHRSNGLGR